MERKPGLAERPATLVSADALAGCIDLASELDFDMRPYLLRHGIDPDLITSQHGLIDFEAMSDLLEDVASAEDYPDFGYRLARAQKPLQFGLIGQAVISAPTVGEAIRGFLKYRELYSEAGDWEMQTQDGVARLRRFAKTGRPGTRQIIVYNATKIVEAMRAAIHKDWQPIGIYFVSDDMVITSAMRRYYRCAIFGASQIDEVAFPAIDLNRPMQTGNPAVLAALKGYFDRLLPDLARYGRVTPRVQKILYAEIGNEAFSLERVAGLLAMHPRTLQRALAAEGTSFRHVAQDVRIQIARQLIESTRMRRADIATSAGYQHASSFARAYHRAAKSKARQRTDAGS